MAKTTAKHGNPLDASRGSAVEHAKRELGNAIDDVLRIEAVEVEQRELEVLANAIGVAPDEARTRLEYATLGELQEWTAAVGTLSRETTEGFLAKGAA